MARQGVGLLGSHTNGVTHGVGKGGVASWQQQQQPQQQQQQQRVGLRFPAAPEKQHKVQALLHRFMQQKQQQVLRQL
jgi:hypothetical protein